MTSSNEPEGAAPARTQILAAAFLTCGLILVGISLIWPRVASSQSNWSQDQARQYQAAALHLHEMAPEIKKQSQQGSDRAGREKIAQAKANYDAMRAQLDSATNRPNRIAAILRYTGLALAAAGAIGFFSGRTANDR